VPAGDHDARAGPGQRQSHGAAESARSPYDERGAMAERAPGTRSGCAAHEVCYYRRLRTQVNLPTGDA
jgi:hypothetical protein